MVDGGGNRGMGLAGSRSVEVECMDEMASWTVGPVYSHGLIMRQIGRQTDSGQQTGGMNHE